MQDVFVGLASGGIGSPVDAEEVRLALSLLADPRHAVQLQAAPSWQFATFKADDLDGASRWVCSRSDAIGIYYALNPVPDGLRRSLRVGDVIYRRWLLIDVDRHKEDDNKDLSATEAEHEAARALTLDVKSYLDAEGWPEPLIVDSGNGFHLLYRIDLPNDAHARVLLRKLLGRLAERFDGERGAIGVECHDARRISKLPGTWARKGPETPERKHSLCRLLHSPTELTCVSDEQLQAVAGLRPGEGDPQEPERAVHAADPFRLNGSARGAAAYGKAALDREAAQVLLAGIGKRNDRLNAAAFSLGQLIGGGLLRREEVEEALYRAACGAGLDRDPGCGERGIRATIGSGIEAGILQPRGVPERAGTTGGSGASSATDVPELVADDVATIHDLIRAGAEVQWLWENWIQNGVLTAIAAKGGTGKTRFCADLVRRIHHGLVWPDGKPMTVPMDALTLWVVADNHHDEMVTLSQTFNIVDAIRINASKADPYGGVTLESQEDYAMLEARIKAVRPAVVIIDTVGNATDKNLSKQEDAKAFYWPLQIIARKYRTAILCLTHLNAAGSFLGRRVLEKVRVALQIDLFEGNEKRRLEVIKSNARRPPALGVTMKDDGNDYDNEPPESLEEGSGKPNLSPKLQQATEWLRDQLSSGPKRVSITRDKAQAAGIGVAELYRAKGILDVEEISTEGYKWWTLAKSGLPE